MIPKIAIRSTGRELSQAVENVTEQIAWEYLEWLEQVQLQVTRPDLFQEGEKECTNQNPMR